MIRLAAPPDHAQAAFAVLASIGSDFAVVSIRELLLGEYEHELEVPLTPPAAEREAFGRSAI